MKPIEANTFNKVCKLKTDHHCTRNYWIMNEGLIIGLAEQKNGEAATKMIRIPKRDFDKLIEWYLKDQVDGTAAHIAKK